LPLGSVGLRQAVNIPLDDKEDDVQAKGEGRVLVQPPFLGSGIVLAAFVFEDAIAGDCAGARAVCSCMVRSLRLSLLFFISATASAPPSLVVLRGAAKGGPYRTGETAHRC